MTDTEGGGQYGPSAGASARANTRDNHRRQKGGASKAAHSTATYSTVILATLFIVLASVVTVKLYDYLTGGQKRELTREQIRDKRTKKLEQGGSTAGNSTGQVCMHVFLRVVSRTDVFLDCLSVVKLIVKVLLLYLFPLCSRLSSNYLLIVPLKIPKAKF